MSTQELKEVEVVASRISQYSIGAHSILLDSSIIKMAALPSLTDIINYNSSIAIKSYGNGMLSTISFRGTGPNHTVILWNGINISYPMLGQSDLSILSLGLSNSVQIQYGSGVPLYGSGALGGTISLSNRRPKHGVNLSVSQWFGSFGTFKNHVHASYANDNFFININSAWIKSENNFKFANTTKIRTPVEEQLGAEYHLLGTSLESGFLLGKNGEVLISGQYFNTDRDIQPSMNANQQKDNQTDENLRLKIKYVNDDKLPWNINYAYLHDIIGFNGVKTYSDRHVTRVGLASHIYYWLKLELTADYNFTAINSPFYGNESKTEQRGNIWASTLINGGERLTLSFNLRQSFNPDYNIPLVPSMGSEFLIVNTNLQKIILKALVAKGFRVPTMNERYWQPGGNLDLVPEQSYSAELGMAGSLTRNIILKYEINAYRMWVDNWILWIPQGIIWSPQNIKYVDVYGTEMSGSLEHRIGLINSKWMLNYAYTKSINRTGIDQFDRSVDKQLAYVPIHKGSVTSISAINNWTLLINAIYTGERFVTADNENSLLGYMLVNLKFSKIFTTGRYNFTGNININNILNSQYQSVENRAMPGINLLIGISVSYNKSIKK